MEEKLKSVLREKREQRTAWLPGFQPGRFVQKLADGTDQHGWERK